MPACPSRVGVRFHVHFSGEGEEKHVKQRKSKENHVRGRKVLGDATKFLSVFVYTIVSFLQPFLLFPLLSSARQSESTCRDTPYICTYRQTNSSHSKHFSLYPKNDRQFGKPTGPVYHFIPRTQIGPFASANKQRAICRWKKPLTKSPALEHGNRCNRMPCKDNLR